MEQLPQVHEPKYIGAAIALAVATAGVALGQGAFSRALLVVVTAAAVAVVAAKAFEEPREVESRRQLLDMASRLASDGEGDGDGDGQGYGKGGGVEGKASLVLHPDMFGVRRQASGDEYTAMHPEVSAALLTLRGYTRSNKGTVKFVLSSVENFFKLFYELLDVPAESQDVLRVEHGVGHLRDLRSSILNALTTLAYARPHAHAHRPALQATVDVIKWRTYRCIKTLHNKHSTTLRAQPRGPPYPDDPSRRQDAYNVHG